MGTPNQRVFDRFRKYSNIIFILRHATHMEINFPPKHGTGIDRLIPNASKECIDLIKLLLIYDPEERITA